MTTAAAMYGTDTMCIDSLRTGRFARGLAVLAQRDYHRLCTPQGTLRGGPNEKNFGLDLAGMCGAAITTALEASIPQRVKNELLKDPQNKAVDVHVRRSDLGGGDVQWTVTVDVDAAVGSFSLVLGVSGVTVELLDLTVFP